MLVRAEPPGALIAGMGSLTVGALACLHDRRVALPERITLVGTGDLTWSSPVSSNLTFIRIYGDDLGLAAVRLALDRLQPKGARAPAREVVLPAPLVLGNTTVVSQQAGCSADGFPGAALQA